MAARNWFAAPRNPRALIRSIQRERHKAAKAHDDDDDDD